jgi:hypothetical protein
MRHSHSLRTLATAAWLMLVVLLGNLQSLIRQQGAAYAGQAR